MSKTIQLKDRSNSSSSQVKQSRAHGAIPAVVYGAGVPSLSVVVDGNELAAALKKNPKAILRAVVAERGEYPVLVKAIQKDMLTGRWLHVDFHQIKMDASIDTMATIHFSGDPAGLALGGMLQIEVHEVAIRCMPDKLFAAFEVDISKLGIGDQLLVSDLELHDGVEVLTDPSVMLVKVLGRQAQDEEVAAATE